MQKFPQTKVKNEYTESFAVCIHFQDRVAHAKCIVATSVQQLKVCWTIFHWTPTDDRHNRAWIVYLCVLLLLGAGAGVVTSE